VMAKRRSAGPSEPEKAHITAACQRFIDEVLKPRFLPTRRTWAKSSMARSRASIG